jgi:hypothetical protein
MMTNEAEAQKDDPQQQKQRQRGKDDPTGSVTNPSQESQIHNNRPQDISKKIPSREGEPQSIGQEKPEDEKRRAS